MKKHIDVSNFKLNEGAEVINENDTTIIRYKSGEYPEAEFVFDESLKGYTCFSFDINISGASDITLILHSSKRRAIIAVSRNEGHRDFVENEWKSVKWFFRDNPGWITPPSTELFDFDGAYSIGICQDGKYVGDNCYAELKNFVLTDETYYNKDEESKKKETEAFVKNHVRGNQKNKKAILWAFGGKEKSCSVKSVAKMFDVYEKYCDMDGLIMEVDDKAFRDNIFTPNELDYDALRSAIEVYKKTDWKNFKHNFFIMDIVGMARLKNPDGSCKRLDWFDDDLFYNKIYPKIAYFCKELRKIGVSICFDNESYSTRPYDYYGIYKGNGKKLEEYQDIVQKRGKEFAEVINKNYPEATVLMMYGPWVVAFDREEDIYGLLPSFYDGLCMAETSVKFIDGFERGYGFSDYESVVKGLYECKNCYKQSKYPEKYKQKIGCGFGVWIRTDFFEKNEFLNMLNASLCETEEYVWIYTETSPVDREDVLDYLSGKIKKQ